MFSNIQIPKTNDDQVFENQIRTLFSYVLDDPNIKKHGTSGQKQDGVDLYGRRKKDGSNNLVGIQCKQTGKDKITKATVRDEANQALSFIPPLREFFIVTQAKDCAELDKEARIFTDEQLKSGREFEVQICGWDQIEALIQQHPSQEVLNVFGLSIQEQLRPIIEASEKGDARIIAEIGELKKEMQKQSAQTIQSSNRVVLTNNSLSVEGLNTIFDKQIDGLRDLINEGKAKTAKGLLENLWETLPEDVEGRIKYRVKANIAACLLRLDQEEEASKTYFEAYDYAPNAPKADAHKVLALILSGKYEKALEFGLSGMETTEDRESLVSNTIMTLKFLPEEKRDLSFIPGDLESNKHVMITKIDLFRALASQANRSDWRKVAHQAYGLYPDESLISRFYAEAIMDEIFEEWDSKRGVVNLSEISIKLRPALRILEKTWEEIKSSETAGDNAYLSIASNLANGYRLVDEYQKAKAVLEEALKYAPQDEVLLEKSLMIAFETNDKEKSKELLAKLPSTRDTELGKIQILFNEGSWEEVSNLPSAETYDFFEEDDQAFYEAIRFLSSCKIGKITAPKKDADKLLKKYPDHIIVPITLFQAAKDIDDDVWARKLYDKCKSLQSNIAMSQRVMLAEIAEDLGDFANILSLLEGIIPEDLDSTPLRLLAVGYANTPITQQAVSFAQNLGDDLLAIDFYARIKGSIFFNHGDLPEAEKAFFKAISVSKQDVSANLGYIRALIRQDKIKQVAHHLKVMNLDQLSGPSYMKMAVAQLIVKYGDPERGIKYGYKIALSDQGTEQTALFYTGMILPNSSKINLPSPGDNVTSDCWVILEGHDGARKDFIISGNINKPEYDHYLPQHEIAKSLIGKKVGEKVTYQPSSGTKNTYKIIQIKNRYVGLLHKITDSFQTRFAGSNKLVSYTTEEGDVQPILDDIKKISEGEQTVRNLYIEQKLPLAFLSGFERGNVIEFANRITDQGHIISSNIGTDQEREHGLSLCNQQDKNGIVLDTYTLWFSYANDLLPLLIKRFGRVAIPQSSMDDLYEWRQKFEDHGDEPLFTIGYRDGEYFRQEIPVVNLKKSYETLDKAIKYIQNDLEVLPAVPASNPSKLEQEILNTPSGKHFFDAIYIAQKENLLLISEDMGFRNIAKQVADVDGVWIQAILLDCFKKGQIDLKNYAESLYALAVQKHGHLSLSAKDLLSLCNENETLDKYKEVLGFIGSPTADIESHVSVTNDFLKILWSSELEHLKKCQATNFILERMAVMMMPHGKTLEFFTALSRNNTDPIRSYIKGWVFGHYFQEI